ncbi:MAG: efflux RND transporter periplasmic adaptor subunit [Myxococcales bacterium]|nr:efflux RND transporter periplasmic adaptor subunit [Myxococcales bacterium]
MSSEDAPVTEPAPAEGDGAPTTAEPSETPAPSPPPEAPPPAPPAPPPRPPRRFGLPTLVLVASIAAALAGTAGYLLAARAHGAASASAAEKQMYQCPMHPTIVQDHPGECPICGMKLVKVEGGAGSSTSGSKERKVKFYRSPMVPKQTSPTPRKDDMGMDFIPVFEDEGSGDVSPVDGLASVDIDPARQQLIGLKTAAVTRGKVSGVWRTVGRVVVDERRVRHVNIKVPVYVERVYVDFVGKPVKRGAPLFSGYSPELLAAQEEYRIALSAQKSLAASPDVPVDSSGLTAAARRKLELLDVPKSAIKRIEQGGKALRALTFHSPIAGVVTKKDVVDGMKLDEGAMPYEIVDLSRVWVLADIYETDLHRVRVGTPAKLILKAYPNRTFEGTAAFIDPVLDPKTRTTKLRLEFANPNGELKPELFGQVTLESGEREGLRIPEDAVIDSGTKKVVFVALGQGKLQPREVVLGDSDGSAVEVVSGLSEGEQVVVRANFLVDSESRLRASLAALTAAADGQAKPAPSASSAPPAPPAPTASGNQPLRTVPPPHSSAAPSAAAPPAPAAVYACPMHPEVTGDKGSRCPKCGMFLTPGGK